MFLRLFSNALQEFAATLLAARFELGGAIAHGFQPDNFGLKLLKARAMQFLDALVECV
jgi:hypothetical protein